MTEKQVHSKNISVELDKSHSTATSLIINGVDVSRCSDISEHVNDFGEYECLCRCIFGDGSYDYGVIGHEMCKDNPNCHYKNWQRKEQECKYLRGDIKDIANILDLDTGEEYSFGNIEVAIKGLKQECEELKREIAFGNNGTLADTIRAEVFKELNKENDQLKAKCEELKQTIQIQNKMQEEVCNEKNKELDRLKAGNDKYSFFIEKLCDYAGLESDNEEQAMRTLSDLSSQMNKARWIIDGYKQTLTEIKEIAEEKAKVSDWLALEILQIIGEVQNDRK